ncbi:MAG: hypothetical protein NTV51_12375 [Verrucomicrobia bacterium]|nr:hypothetical protein [Verrucomicrobiota bacterium]
MFDLHFIDRRKKLARIRIGAFEEDFGVSMKSTTTALEREWRRLLATLFGRKKKVALPVWRRGRVISRAWLFYRVGDAVFVRDRVFFRGLDPQKSVIPKRRTKSAEDRRVSEWSIDAGAIAVFLKDVLSVEK